MTKVLKVPKAHVPEPAYVKWHQEHIISCLGKGWATSAYYGLQWNGSKWYISEHCGCGSRFRMMKGEEPIIDWKEFKKLCKG